MKIATIALLLLAGSAAGCAGLAPAPLVSVSDLPDCFESNYDKERGLFTIMNDVGKAVNQQCLLTVGPRAAAAPASALAAGRYRVYLADGGGGGAGGTMQPFHRGDGGGGGGGGGAGSKEIQATVDLSEGVYKLTLGAGGPGGTACVVASTSADRSISSGGGPGWLGSPSNMVRVATGELVIGTPGADSYARLTRGQHDRSAGKKDAHGGSGPGQASGGQGSVAATASTARVEAAPGAGKPASAGAELGGAPGSVSVADKRPGVGGGGGATSIGQGGGGGGESPGQNEQPPVRGSLGSGGGGGEGSTSECDPGARGGHGYIALRRN